MIIHTGFVDLDTPTGPMRTHVYAPALPTGTARYPGLLLYPEIYQQTGPIVRLSQQLAGHGYVVMAPEIYHEHEPPGTVLAYDKAGTDKGNAYKAATTLATFDHDAAVVIRALGAHPACNGRIGAVGVCLGGHLAFRAALQSQVLAAACFYATDLQGGILAGGTCVDTLARTRDIRGELLLVWAARTPTSPMARAPASTRPSSPPARRSPGTSSTPSTPSCATRDRATTPRPRASPWVSRSRSSSARSDLHPWDTAWAGGSFE